MIEIIENPQDIHTIYNPVIFKFFSELKKPTILYLVLNGDASRYTKIELEFTNKHLSADIRIPLLSLFAHSIERSAILTTDAYQSIEYELKQDLAAESLKKHGQVLRFTAIKAVAQIQQEHTIPRNKLLTGFQELKVWNGYPRDVSIMSGRTNPWKGFSQVPNRINRLEIDCNDTVAPDFQIKCISRWSDFICQIEAESYLLLGYNNKTDTQKSYGLGGGSPQNEVLIEIKK